VATAAREKVHQILATLCLRLLSDDRSSIQPEHADRAAEHQPKGMTTHRQTATLTATAIAMAKAASRTTVPINRLTVC
jgi:hypothetical protein